AEERRLPDLLALKGQRRDTPQLIGDAQSGDTAVITVDRGGQSRMARQHRLGRAELLGLEIDDHLVRKHDVVNRSTCRGRCDYSAARVVWPIGAAARPGSCRRMSAPPR